MPCLNNSSFLFQFHKGSINTALCNEISGKIVSFNSIKVRLIPVGAADQQFAVVKFQFHKGSINTLGYGVDSFGVSMFQFHKGSINTMAFDPLSLIPVMFQFHKGSINTYKCSY